MTNQKEIITIPEEIIKLREREEKNRILEINHFRDTIDTYFPLMKMAAKLVQELGLPDNTISYSYVIKWLIDDGVFSYQGSFRHQEDIDDTRYGTVLRGAQVLLGYGCCRHVAKLHEDIFDQLWLQGNATTCVTENEKDDSFLITGNHQVNVINYLGTNYINDIYNGFFSYFRDGQTMVSYRQGYPSLTYCPYGDMVIDGKTEEEIREQMIQFEQSSNQVPIDYSQVLDIIQSTSDRYNQRTSLIKDFKQESKPYVKKIVNDLTNPERNARYR